MTIIVGTRPQIIKSAPVYDALARANIPCSIIDTGQHYDYAMNEEFFSEFKLPAPQASLKVGKGTPNEQIARIISRLGRHLLTEKPHLAIVPGDTNSALAAGIACSKSGTPIAHLESGCRSWDMGMSEEINRRVLDHISTILLATTRGCLINLRSEHAQAPIMANVGDTMLDLLLRNSKRISNSSGPQKYGLDPGSYVFMTLHRAESVDESHSLLSILKGVGNLKVPVLFSVHPRTRSRLKSFRTKVPSNVILCNPLPYLETLHLVKESKLVVTDSGGLQKEAFWQKKPALITRKNTEWTEIIQTGAALLVGTTAGGIEKGYEKMSKVKARSFKRAASIFGNGKASENVATIVGEFLKNGSRRDGSD